MIIQDGENRHEHRILHITQGQNVQFVAQWYAAHFYGDNVEYNRDIDFWEFNAGSIAVQLYSVVELSEFEYNLLKRIFDNDPKPENYFEIVRAGNYPNMDREEIQIHCGKNGNLFIFKTDEGFIVDVYNQNDNVNTMAIWEEDLEIPEETQIPLVIHPSDKEIQDFKAAWGQSHKELCDALGLGKKTSDDIIMLDYFWIAEDKMWYNKEATLFTPREQLIADYLRHKQ